MATLRSSIPHEARTAAEPRENQLEPVTLTHINNVNDSLRTLRLTPVDPNRSIRFSPGQWLDTFIPGLKSAGGFTITSTPREARPSTHGTPFLELAIQKSANPPAQWLWQDEQHILGKQLVVRVGGSFTWPPPNLDVADVERLVFVAGGVGINPLISMFSDLVRSARRPSEIHFLYSTKTTSELNPQSILFLPRLLDLCAMEADPNVTLSLYLTGIGEEGKIEDGRLPNRTFGRRLTENDIVRALDGYKTSIYGAEHDRLRTLCYVCGPPSFTDSFVDIIKRQPGMAEERVLCEKWW